MMFDVFEFATLNEERTQVSQGTPGERQYYVVNPGEVYPAVVQFLTDNMGEIGRVYAQGDAALVGKALAGDFWAGFIVRARRTIADVLAVPDRGWELALVDRADLPADRDDADVVARAQALEAARLFFTEALHQAIQNAPMGIRWTKDERFKLEAAGY
jgi:hypothetical protein